jgi:hypothetical protein
MSNETIILLQNLSTISAGSAFSFTNKTPGPGYHRQDDSTRTASYDFTNFVGTVKIQASLDLIPGDNDWFDIIETTFIAGSSANTTESYSFNGNFIWIRAAYNLQSGSINRIAVDGITVTSVSRQLFSGINFDDITNKPTTLSGYGIVDAVRNWQIIRSNYAAQNGDRLIADTSDGPFTIALPGNPTEGFFIEIADGDNFAENNLLLTSVRPVENFDQDIIFDIKGLSLEFVYVGTAWQILTTLGVKGDKGDPGDSDLTGYATEEYVDNAIAAIASVDGGAASTVFDNNLTIDGGGA